MNKKLKVLVLFDSAGPPPENQDYSKELKHDKNWTAEANVINTLKGMGHDVRPLGIYNDIHLMTNTVKDNPPDIVFNLVEQFSNQPIFDRNIAGYLELLGIPFTGTKLPGLMLCKNKGLSKKILNYHRIKTPAFNVYQRCSRIIKPNKRLSYPVLIKPLREEASYGISQNSLVDNDKDFIDRINFVHESMAQDAIAEEFITGRELYVSILGNHRLQVFPFREMVFNQIPNDEQKFATYKAKWDEKYRKKWGISNLYAEQLSDTISDKISRTCKRVYHLLEMQGYGRIDIRLTPDNEIYVIEANPNPFIAFDEDFALSAQKAGLEYDQLIQKIINLGLGNSIE